MTVKQEHLGDKVVLHVPGEVDSLALVRDVITHMADEAGLPGDDVGQIEIAVDEACTNVIEHAYRDLEPKPPVRLEVQSTPENFIIDIFDEGQAFDFEHYEPPVFPDHWEAGNTRGVGLYLIKQCMDEIAYETLPDNTNRFRLIKHIPA